MTTATRANTGLSADDIKTRVSPAAFYQSVLPGMPTPRRESGWVDAGLCPFHLDTHAGSFRVDLDSGAFKCFSCGAAGGDVISFIQRRDGVPFADALATIAETWNVPSSRPASNGIYEIFKGMPRRHIWTYRDRRGAVLGYVARYDDGAGQKAIVPFLQQKAGQWAAGAGPAPRPLYGVDRLDSTGTVFVVEGEKCCDALHSLGLSAVTSPGGARSAHKADWAAVQAAGRIIILPDHDEPGEGYARDVLGILSRLPGQREVVVCRLPDLPDGGDVCDWLQERLPGWDGFKPVPREPGDDLVVDLLAAVNEHCEPVPADAAATDTAEIRAEDETAEHPAGEVFKVQDFSGWRFMARQEIPFVFKDAVVRGTTSAIIGAPKTGKSIYALQAAVGLALGREIAPGLAPVRPGRVLCIFTEDPAIITSRRLEAICAVHDVPPDEIDRAIAEGRLSFGPADPAAIVNFRAGTPSPSAYMEACLRHVETARPDMIVFDPLVAFEGSTSEYDNTQRDAAFRELRRLARAVDGAVLVLHHQSKAGTGSMDANASRGGTALQGAVRWQANLNALDESELRRYSIDAAVAPRFVKMNVALNQYAPRTAEPIFMERKEGGILTMASLAGDAWGAMAKALPEILTAQDCHISLSELLYARSAAAKSVKLALGNPARKDIEAIVSSAQFLGLLEEVVVPGPGVQRKELRASKCEA